jgi:hypothetical protein
MPDYATPQIDPADDDPAAIVVRGGALAKLAATHSPGSFSVPSSISEAGMALTNAPPHIIARVV